MPTPKIENSSQIQRIILAMVIVLGLGLSALAQSSQCQPTTGNPPCQGQPMVANVTNQSPTLTTDPQGTVVDAYLYTGGTPGNDMCTKIKNAWTYSASQSGNTSLTIDARGFASGNEACSVSPIPTTAIGRLLLGNQTIKAQMPWIIPSGVEIDGSGVNTTTIQAAGGGMFNPDNTGALIEIGSSSQASDLKFRGITVDCANVNGCNVGVYNQAGTNNARVEDVTINNAPTAGLEVLIYSSGVGAQDSGTYRNITVQYPNCSHCGGSTYGVLLMGADRGTIVRAIENVKVSGLNGGSCGTFAGAAGIQVVGASVKIVNTNIACFNTGILIAPSTTSPDLTIHNVQIDNAYYLCTLGVNQCTTATTGNGVAVSVDNGTSNVAAHITLSNISGIEMTSGTGVNKLIQYYNSNLTPPQAVYLGGPFQGFLSLGDGTGTTCNGVSCQSVFSTYYQTKWFVPGGITH